MTGTITFRDDKIYGLPTNWRAIDGSVADLSRVPMGPRMADDPALEGIVVDWLKWATEIVRYRTYRIKATEGMIPGVDAGKEQELEWLRCERDPAYFVTVWCHVMEYRGAELQNFPWYSSRFEGWLPFIPFPYQINLIRWLDRKLDAAEEGKMNGALSKSRDVGATDITSRWGLHGYIFRRPFHVKYVSRMGDLVDQIGNMDSIFERIVSHLIDEPQNAPLPAWMAPEGWNKFDHRRERLITHPTSRNMISGEATTSRTGRGGRATIIFIDEAAFIKGLRSTLASTQATADHVIGLSSESVETDEYWMEWVESLRQQDPDNVFDIDYWMHPFHDSEWLARTKSRYGDDENAFLREVMRQAEAGFGGWMYPEAREMEIIPEERNLFLDPHGEEVALCHSDHAQLYMLIDPGLNDNAAIWFLMHDPICGRDTVLRSWEAQNREQAEYIAAVMCGIPFDDDGRFQVFDIHTQQFRYNFFFPPATQELIEWVRRMPPPKMIFGDPYGENESTGPQTSWYWKMMNFWKEFNPRMGSDQKPLVYKVVVNWNSEGRGYIPRRNAMKQWLKTRLDFNNHPTAARALEALSKSRWDDDPDKPRQQAQKTAKHDKWSHLRTAGEFGAVNLEVIHNGERMKKTGNGKRAGYDPIKNPRARAA